MSRTELYMVTNHLAPDEIVSATALECEQDLRGITGEGAYEIEGYCSQKSVGRCSECRLCNNGRDCHNNDVA